MSSPASYTTRLARNRTKSARRRFCASQVFNLGLNEGLAQSYVSGLDEDPFDHVCDHLIVEHLPSHQIVGTYRLQTGANAAASLGYYRAQEFEFEVFEPLRPMMIESGRACVHASIAIWWCWECYGKGLLTMRDNTMRAICSAAVPSPPRTR